MYLFDFHSNLIISLKHNKEQHFLVISYCHWKVGEKRDVREKLGSFAFMIAWYSCWTTLCCFIVHCTLPGKTLSGILLHLISENNSVVVVLLLVLLRCFLNHVFCKTFLKPIILCCGCIRVNFFRKYTTLNHVIVT